MRFRLLACDYDRTIAVEALVPAANLEALQSVRDSGRTLVLVTGRTMDELLDVFRQLELFGRIVIENGAVVYDPATDRTRLLAAPAPEQLVDALARRKIDPLILGRVIISTHRRHDVDVLEALGELGLDLQLSYNRDSAMVLPPGVSKATGLRAAAEELGVPISAVVAVGDGENDLALLDAAEVGVAVENAVDSLKERAEIVLTRPTTEGIADLCESLVERDLDDRLEEGAARVEA